MDHDALGLVEQARRGDEDAWTALYLDAYPRLVAFAHRRLGGVDLAREAVSETMARAVIAIDRYVGDDPGFVPWLFGICRHVIADMQRQLFRAVPVRLFGQEAHFPGPAETVLDNEERALVRAAFERLDDDERELLELRVLAGLSSADVAIALGSRPGAVRMAQKRALARLRTFVEEACRVA